MASLTEIPTEWECETGKVIFCRYECQASNPFGKSFYHIHLKIWGKPASVLFKCMISKIEILFNQSQHSNQSANSQCNAMTCNLISIDQILSVNDQCSKLQNLPRPPRTSLLPLSHPELLALPGQSEQILMTIILN